MQKEKAKIDVEVLLVLSDIKATDKSGTQIRVVRWIVDGKKYDPTIEKRPYSFNAKGEKIFRKAKGFSVEELQMICSKREEIAKATK